jgi:hypothetical protein
MQEKDGIIIYGCWHLILQVASKMPVRGTLLREDRTPITADVLALKTGWRNPRDFTRALSFLSSTQMLWIELLAIEGAEIPQSTAEIPHEGARNGMEWNGMEVKGIELSSSAPTSRKRTVLIADDEWLATVKATYTPLGIDVDREAAKAKAWLATNPAAKGRKFTRGFFARWLSRADKPLKTTRTVGNCI